MVVESYVVVHNIAKRHNVGTLARSATALGVSELILVGRRDFNSFGSHGSTSHLRFRHFHSLLDARHFLKVLCLLLNFRVPLLRITQFEFDSISGKGLRYLWRRDYWQRGGCESTPFQEEHRFPSWQRGIVFSHTSGYVLSFLELKFMCFEALETSSNLIA